MLLVHLIQNFDTRDVTEPANVRIRRMRISHAKSIGFGCGFVAQSNYQLLVYYGYCNSIYLLKIK